MSYVDCYGEKEKDAAIAAFRKRETENESRILELQRENVELRQKVSDAEWHKPWQERWFSWLFGGAIR